MIDRNIVNYNLLDNNIDKLINMMIDTHFIEKNYHEVRELAFQCLEKTDMTNIIHKLLYNIIHSNIFTLQQKKDIIVNTANLHYHEKMYCKSIYILEAILSKIILIYNNKLNT